MTKDLNLKDLTFLISAISAVLLLLTQLIIRIYYAKLELDLRRKEYDEKKAERQKHDEFLTQQTAKIINVSEILGDHIAEKLKKDSAWASSALERAKLGPYAETLFAQRLNHFRDEKETIADCFVPWLLDRCKHHIQEHQKHICLLIDSGTTLFPVFKRLGMEAKWQDNEPWLAHFTVATNNLPGVEALMELARKDAHDRYSNMTFDCRLLPGSPLPPYSAVVGEDTEAAVAKLDSNIKTEREILFIGLLTGNWIRLRRKGLHCPVPLVRGRLHWNFKQAVLGRANEIYVLAPLGKIFANASEEQVNKALGFDGSSPNKEPYRDLKFDEEKASSLKLVSTSRRQNRVLSELSIRVCDHLHAQEGKFSESASSDVEQINHLCFPFDKLPPNWYLEKEVEFPHGYTRDEELRKKWFYVPADPPHAHHATA